MRCAWCQRIIDGVAEVVDRLHFHAACAHHYRLYCRYIKENG